MYINKHNILLKVTFSTFLFLILFLGISFTAPLDIAALETYKYSFQIEEFPNPQEILLNDNISDSSYLVISANKTDAENNDYLFPIDISFNGSDKISTTFSSENSSNNRLVSGLIDIPVNTMQVKLDFSSLAESNLFENVEVEIIDPNSNRNSKNFNTSATGETYKIGEARIVSRDGWGCKDNANGADPNSDYYCDNPFWSTSYFDATHITVHHTATDNSSSDWSADVRAIWYYHSHIRDADPGDGVQGWTDIGYHYLIDPNGVIYEGRYGNRIDDGTPDGQINTGGHVIGSNRGNIGIALIGDFTNVAPTSNAIISLTTLMQALINRYELNPGGIAVSNSGQTKPVISGHRDWSPTACPGNRLYPMINSISLYSGNEGNNGPIHRFWSHENQRHFFTRSYLERNTIIYSYSKNVWRYEGVAFNGKSSPETSADQPVYRFWSNANNSHFYTINKEEKELIENTYPQNVWRYEGIAFYAATGTGSLETPNKPVYRFWSVDNKTHFYTISLEEKELIERSYPDNVWRYEGIAFYVE